MAQEERYKIVVTTPAKKRYQGNILPYLSKHFSLERAIEIDQSILNTISSLNSIPSRGVKEKYLDNFKEDFRYILHKESRNFELKIIYFIQENSNTVYVVDFFPTLMKPDKMISR